MTADIVVVATAGGMFLAAFVAWAIIGVMYP